MNFIRHICKDTFDKCLIMLHPKQSGKDTHEYSNVAHEMKEEAVHHEEHEEDEYNDSSFAAWPTKKTETAKIESPHSKESTKVTQSTLDSEPSTKEKRPVLIGNLDEESISKKKEQINDKDDELFAKMSMDFGTSPDLVINKTVIDSKKAQKDRLDKFKMDEELEPIDGWGDDNDVNI